jgi:APA family basic amino acid/polyamine antiporter
MSQTEVQPTLRRALTPWGSFSWGYSDVGADIFVGLGLVLGAAGGGANIAFLFAGVVYVCIGLAYTELASTYPVAGGGQYFVMRGLGDIFGFIAGWAVLLDFTIDITLFAWSCVDYLGQLIPALGVVAHPWTHFIIALLLIAGLCVLNVIGVRESTSLNGFVAALDVISETSILFFGFLFAFNPDLLVHSMTAYWPTTHQLLLGASLAIISFVGLESISQAAQETQRPASIIPRTSISLILTILVYALAYSNLAIGMTPSHPIPLTTHHHTQTFFQFLGNSENSGSAVAVLAANVPFFGIIAAFYVPLLGAVLLLISSNSGVFGASRIAYAMSRAQLLPSAFERVLPRFRTPAVSIVTFCSLAVVVLIFAALPGLDPAAKVYYLRFFHGEAGIDVLADLYAFGAATSYSFVFVALIALRLRDPLSPRKFLIPFNIPMHFRGERVLFPIVGVLGFAGIFSILVFTMLTHAIGRVAGPAWLILGLIGYIVYRTRKSLPVWKSQAHDWIAAQTAILRDAGELELMDELLTNVRLRTARIAAAEKPEETRA